MIVWKEEVCDLERGDGEDLLVDVLRGQRHGLDDALDDPELEGDVLHPVQRWVDSSNL